jgi:2,3-bisphosphoglycerate-dependent phosphoglycerate mutase
VCLKQVFLVALVALQAARGTPAAPDDVLRIYLARHGQTEWNAAGRMQGSADIPLNEKGRAQARELAARLASVPFDAIYSSTLQRSRQTADAFKGRAPIQALAGLDEQSVGAFTGLTQDERDRARREAFDRRQEDPDDTLDGGESANQHLARVRTALQAIRDAHPRGNVLVVAHGGTNEKILQVLLGLDHQEASAIDQANDEVYLLEVYSSGRPTVWKLVPPDRLKEL